MAGQLTVDQLRASTGVLATQNGMTGIAKAWVNFNPSGGSSAVIRSSFNVSSVTYVGTGIYTINYTTAMPDANYSISGAAMRNYAAGTGVMPIIVAVSNDTTYSNIVTTTSAQIKTAYIDGTGALVNPLAVFVSICGI